jgi:hypothetical protein
MEQQLINVLIKLIAKAGGASLIKDLILQVDENGNPKVWTTSEIVKATEFVEWQIQNFGTAEATAMIESLLKKYNIDPNDLRLSNESLEASPDVRGLQ